MDASLAAAGPMRPPKRKRSFHKKGQPTAHKTVDRGEHKEAIDPSTNSISTSTRVPGSFQSRNSATGKGAEPLRPDASVSKIADKKSRARVARTGVAGKKAKQERADVDEWSNQAVSGGQGGIEVEEDEGERTWRVGQDEIVQAVGVSNAHKKFDLRFDNMGNYMVDYTRNGRHLAIASQKGHVATFDWKAGKLNAEIQLREAVRDIKFLQNEDYFAVAQKKYVFIYDRNGVESHKLKDHIDPVHMEFSPYHYLLSTVGHAGHLKYHDVSTGQMSTQIATRLGSPASMAQNPHSAIIHSGHQNGTMTMWSPNSTTPHVKSSAHRGPVAGIAIDPSENSAGRYCATAGSDGTVKLWDGRMWGKEVRHWTVRNAPSTSSYSGRGISAVGGKSGVTTYRDTHRGSGAPKPYLTLPTPGLSAFDARFCPFEDVLAVGHEKGISSLLVPGSGEANFDSNEADVFESYSRRRERDVRSVSDKIRPELITMDTDFLGHINPSKGGETHAEREGRSYRQSSRIERLKLNGEDVDGSAEAAANGTGASGESRMGINDEDEESGDDEDESTPEGKKKKKMRGRNKAMKRYSSKKKKNVIDPASLAVREKVEAQKRADEQAARVARGEVVKESGALARFG